MGRRLYYCDHHPIPLPPGHKFPIEKYALLRGMLEADGFYELEPAPFADRETLEQAHDPAYVRAFLDGSLDPRAVRRIGFPWSEYLVRRTLASVGGTIEAARDALACGIGGNLAGGTHHAFRGEGSGFCVFNDLAVAILTLRREGRIARAAVIDLDVHQGDGVAGIFENDPDVWTFSMHAANNFPFRKQHSKLDIELADGAGDAEYLRRLCEALPAVAAFGPDLVMYQSGVDGLAGDRLGRLSLSHAGLIARDEMVFRFTKAAGIPVAITPGGGYGDPISRTAEAHANTFRAAAALYGGGA
jgi:acetoin utilization deacetylase AcuC-like enzyme